MRLLGEEVIISSMGSGLLRELGRNCLQNIVNNIDFPNGVKFQPLELLLDYTRNIISELDRNIQEFYDE